MLVVVRACEGDHEIASDSAANCLRLTGRRLHRFLALGRRVDCRTDKVGGCAVGLDNLAHSRIVPLFGHRDVVSMIARGRARGETSTFEVPARVITGRAPRGRAASAVMSVAPMTPAATSVDPSCTVAPTTAATPVGKRGTRTSTELRGLLGPLGVTAMRK